MVKIKKGLIFILIILGVYLPIFIVSATLDCYCGTEVGIVCGGGYSAGFHCPSGASGGVDGLTCPTTTNPVTSFIENNFSCISQDGGECFLTPPSCVFSTYTCSASMACSSGYCSNITYESTAGGEDTDGDGSCDLDCEGDCDGVVHSQTNVICVNSNITGFTKGYYWFVNGTQPQENLVSSGCSDGIDNDCDGCSDAVDSSCGGIETSCTDGIDNDCDKLTDCFDSVNCGSNPSCITCVDNDNDKYNITGGINCGVVDCDDNIIGDPPSGCPLTPAGCNSLTTTCAICVNQGVTENCTDVIDNNCNGRSDYDYFDGLAGDAACPVDMLSASLVVPGDKIINTNFDVSCRINITNIGRPLTTIYASVIDTSQDCIFKSESSGNHIFTCNTGSTPNSALTIWCGMYAGTYSVNRVKILDVNVIACSPSCTGKECGDDGCGGSCGTCGASEECISNQCYDNSVCTIVSMDWSDDFVWEGELVDLNVLGTSMCNGREIGFDVYQEITGTDPHITDNGGSDPDNATFSNGWANETNWESQYFGYSGDGGISKLYYKIFGNGISQTGTDILEVGRPECDGILTCGDFNNSEDCENYDQCWDILNQSWEDEGTICGYDCSVGTSGLDCSCEWNNDQCVPKISSHLCSSGGTDFIPGICTRGQGIIEGCDSTNHPGLYKSSWSGIWSWVDNFFSNQASCEAVGGVGNCTVIDNQWRIDPTKIGALITPASCEQGGTTIINCPAEVVLPFFNFNQLVIAILFITGVYLIIALKKSKNFAQAWSK